MDNLMNSIGLVNNESKVVNLISEIPEDIIIGWSSVNGEKFPRVAWSSLEEAFPKKWIHHCEDEVVLDGSGFITTVIAICNEDNTDSVDLDLFNKGFRCSRMCTTSDMTVGVIE